MRLRALRVAVSLVGRAERIWVMVESMAEGFLRRSIRSVLPLSISLETMVPDLRESRLETISYRTNPAVFVNSSSRRLDRLLRVDGERTESEEATREKPKADAKV